MAQASVTPQTAVAAEGLVWDSGPGLLTMGTGYTILFPRWSWSAATEAGTVAQASVPLPRDARIERAVFEVSADAVAKAALATVATVTASTPTAAGFTAAVSIDFGAMVTVGGIELPDLWHTSLSIDDVQRWDGTGWRPVPGGASFSDLATQRLLVQSSATGATAEALAGSLLDPGVGVRLPVVPSGLELLVDGRSVWFERQGSSSLPGSGTTGSGTAGSGTTGSGTTGSGAGSASAGAAPSGTAVRYVVERTDALREAFDRAVRSAPPDAAEVVVPVTLRAGAPGALVITPKVDSLRVHAVTFVPEGPSRSLDLAEEGLVAVDVSVPGADAVHEVALTARGRFGPERVWPAVGPDLTTAARLALTAGRTVLIGLPRTLLSRFSTLSGVRLRLQVPDGGSGGQLTGRLLTTTAQGRPGDALPGGELAPLAVTAAAAAWYTLPLAEPLPVPPAARVVPVPPPAVDARPEEDHVGLWLELQPSYGEVECLLTPAPVLGVTAPGAPLRRRLAGGATVAPTTITALGPLLAAVRLVGLPDRDAPLPAVTFQVQGSPESLGATPTKDGVGVVLTLQTPVSGTASVTLAVTCAAPGSLTVEDVRVTYQPTTEPT